MATRIIIFEMLQLAVSSYALARGGLPERVVALLLLLAATSSIAIGAPPDHYRSFWLAGFAIDASLFVALFAVAARANRFWPLWVAALQLVALAIHGVRAYDPYFLPVVYSRLSGRVAYLICFVLVVGTMHFRRRIRLQGVAPAPWAALRW